MVMLDFPRLRQSHGYDCGAIVTQAILEYYGKDIREDKIIKLARTNRKGTSPRGIIKTLKKYGLRTKTGKLTISQIKKYLNKRHPVILALQAWDERNKDWEDLKKETEFYKKKNIAKKDWEHDWSDGHYVVAIGYDKKKMYFEDPGFVLKEYLKFDELMKRWHDIKGKKSKGKKYIHFGIAVYGKKKVYDGRKAFHMP
ncbi:C39 family peptidase [Candidatus Pacearchaeota archaeon]|nr:C39 family peptidase [Candidatus Pacearchaeota archaeon]